MDFLKCLKITTFGSIDLSLSSGTKGEIYSVGSGRSCCYRSAEEKSYLRNVAIINSKQTMVTIQLKFTSFYYIKPTTS